MTFEEKCQMTDEEWEERQKTRQLEMDKELKATAILIRDDDHDLFTRNSNPSLLQKSSATHSERQTQASEVLSAVAGRLHSPRLATLAFRISLDAFTHVKKAKKDDAEGFRKASPEKARDDEAAGKSQEEEPGALAKAKQLMFHEGIWWP